MTRDPARTPTTEGTTRDVDPNWRMIDALRTYWMRQMLAAIVYVAGGAVLYRIVPNSWPIAVKVPLFFIPLFLAVYTLVIFRRRDARRERANQVPR